MGDIVQLSPLTLTGPRLRLVPLEPRHHSTLCEIGLDERLWQFTTIGVRTPAEMSDYMQVALDAQAARTALPFAIELIESRQIIGTTRFHSYDPVHRRIE